MSNIMWNSRRELQSQWAWLLKIPLEEVHFRLISIKVFPFPLVFGSVDQLPAGGVVQGLANDFLPESLVKITGQVKEERAG